MTEPVEPPAPPPGSRRRIPPGAAIGMSVLAAAVVAGVVVFALRRTDHDVPPPQPGPNVTISSQLASPTQESAPTPVTAATLAGAVASTTCEAPDSQDSAGNPTTYPADNAIDGSLTTAWRCDGDGTNESLTLSFPGTVQLSAVGLIPGLAKTDPASGVDRYAQNRRISSVRLTFDDGRAVVGSLDTSPSNRQMQWLRVGGVATSKLTITILSSDPGIAQGDLPANETVALSEIGVS